MASELLQSFESSLVAVAPKRSEIFADVMEHYDRAVNAAPVELTLVDGDEIRQRRSTRPIEWLWRGAAAILAVIAIGVLALDRDGSPPTQIDATHESTNDTATTQPSASDGMAPTQPGDRLTLFDDSISFDSGGLFLTVGETAALLSPDANPIDVTDSIVIVDLGDDRFGERITQLELDGSVTAGSAFARTDADGIDRWIIGLSQIGADQLGCVINLACLELVEGVAATDISSGTHVWVAEVTSSDGRSVLLLTDSNGPLRVAYTELLLNLTVS